MKLRSLTEWLAWLETLHPREIELGLDRIHTVALRLNIPASLAAQGVRIVTIAGTNGKGSCVAASVALLSAMGARVGSYTSPHLLCFNERIRIAGEMVADDDLLKAFSDIEAVRDATPLTYFEYTTLAALLVFIRAELDVILLEVGLGGRLDAVNILDPDIAVLTSVALDHQDWLGNDRETIGREKAGIFRAGKPALCVDPDPPSSVVQHAAAVGAHWLNREILWQVIADAVAGNTWQWQGVDTQQQPLSFTHLPIPNLPLPSVAAALQVAVLLRDHLVSKVGATGATLSPELVSRVLANLSLAGRCQRFDVQEKIVLLDVAHNEAAAAYLAKQLAAIPAPRKHAVFAVMADKDYRGIFEQLSSSFDQWWVGGLPDLPRAASPQMLEQALVALGQPVTAYARVREAYAAALAQAAPGELIVVFGSFYTVAEILADLTEHS